MQLIPSANLLSKSRLFGSLRAFFAGILAGIFASPCSTPVLIALLGMVAGNGKPHLGYSAHVALFPRTQYVGDYCGHVCRICIEKSASAVPMEKQGPS